MVMMDTLDISRFYRLPLIEIKPQLSDEYFAKDQNVNFHLAQRTCHARMQIQNKFEKRIRYLE